MGEDFRLEGFFVFSKGGESFLFWNLVRLLFVLKRVFAEVLFLRFLRKSLIFGLAQSGFVECVRFPLLRAWGVLQRDWLVDHV